MSYNEEKEECAYCEICEDDEWFDDLEEDEDPILITLDEVNNNLEKGVPYQIYGGKTPEGYNEMIIGENILVVNEDSISFLLESQIPFKYHRGILSLEQEIKLFVDLAKMYFKNKEEFKVDASCEENDAYMCYSIEITSNSTDVNAVVNTVFDFNSKFNEKLIKIRNEVLDIINKLT